jgi:hypothetical protein
MTVETITANTIKRNTNPDFREISLERKPVVPFTPLTKASID